MKTVCFIQARMGSTRFPGKVLTKIAGEPLLAHQIRRLTRCTDLDEIVITTTSNPADQPIVDLARQENVGWFCGSEHDVVSRFVDAARQTRAEVIVRVTADCPLIDPDITDRVIRELTGHSTECDYASNVGQTTAWSVVDGEETTVPLQRTFPRGLDAEAFFYDTLLRIDRMAQTPKAREHVTVLPRSERADLFLCRTVLDEQDNSDLRWTVDTPSDIQLMHNLFHDLDLGSRTVPYPEILAHVRATPHLEQMNLQNETVTG